MVVQETVHGSYPSSDEIRYAGQLKAFAVRLPAYAQRYELTPIQVLEANLLALECMELLIYQLVYISDWLRRGQGSIGEASMARAQLAPLWQEQKRAIQERTGAVISHIAEHSNYVDADGQALGLPLLSYPPSGY